MTFGVMHGVRTGRVLTLAADAGMLLTGWHCHMHMQLQHAPPLLSCALACRLLQYSVDEAARVIAPPLAAVTSFAEEQSPELRDRIFDEFNTLAVIYREPSAAFLRRGATDAPPNGIGQACGLSRHLADQHRCGLSSQICHACLHNCYLPGAAHALWLPCCIVI